MENNVLKLSIITPEGFQIKNQEVEIVNVQTVDGDMGIYVNHAPLISTLRDGKLSFQPINGDRKEFQLHNGIVKVSQDEVKVITEAITPVVLKTNKK